MAQDLPPLDEFALLRIDAAETEARRQLEITLRRFFENLDPDNIVTQEVLKSGPSMALLPAIEPYAKAVFDAYAKERLALVSSGERGPRFIQQLDELAEEVVNKIYGSRFENGTTVLEKRLRRTLYRRIGDGVWLHAVQFAFNNYSPLIAYPIKGREYALGDFLRPNMDKIRATLRERQLYWKAEALAKIAAVGSDQVGRAASPADQEAVAAQPQEAMDANRGDAKKGISADPVAAERKVLLTDFKSKARASNIKVTDPMVAKAANSNWNDRTMVTWWKRNDNRCKPPHDKLIRAVLKKDPQSLWPRPEAPK